MKKKCYYNIYKHFKILSQLGLFSFLLLLSFLFTNSVKAESSIYLEQSSYTNHLSGQNVNGNIATISYNVPSSCSSPLLIVATGIYRTNSVSSVSFNDVSLTNIVPPDTYVVGSLDMSIWYTTNLSFVNDYIEVEFPNGYGENIVSTYLYCNVDSEDPFYFSDFVWSNSRDSNGFGLSSFPAHDDLNGGAGVYYLFTDNQATASSSVSTAFSDVPSDFTISLGHNYAYFSNSFDFSYPLSTTDFWFSPASNIYDYNNDQFFNILNEAQPPKRLEVYSDIVVGENGKKNGLPIPLYYNYCDKYADLENVYLSLCEDWDGENCYDDGWRYIILKGTYDLNPCERFMYYKPDVYNYPDNYFDENGIYEFDGIMRLTLDYIDELEKENEYIDSETFTVRIYQPNTNYNPQNYIESGVNSPLILPITATSTDVSFIYDLSSYNWNATSSEVCLYNIESSTVADSFCSTLSKDKGIGNITLTGNGTNYEDTFGFVYLEEGQKKLYSDDNFFVQWGEGLAYYDKFEDYNIEALSGLSTHDMACSAEEWTEADEDGVFNFTRLKCRSIKTGLDIANSIILMFRKSIELLKNQVIGNAFPLNIPYKISQSWKLSENLNLPTELNYLDSGENGNLKISIPEEWMGTTSTEIVVWGSEVFNETEETTNTVFNFIRALSKYTIWLLVIIYLLNLAISAFEEFMPKKQTAELQDINIDNRGRISSHYHIFDD